MKLIYVKLLYDLSMNKCGACDFLLLSMGDLKYLKIFQHDKV